MTNKLQEDFNVFTQWNSGNPHEFQREQEYSRFDCWNELPVHENSEEEGFLLVFDGRPTVRIGDRTCVAEPGDVFHFKAGELHGIEVPDLGGQKVIVFHGRTQGKFQL